MLTFGCSNRRLDVVALLSWSSAFTLQEYNFIFGTADGTSSLADGRRGLLKILHILMNMD